MGTKVNYEKFLNELNLKLNKYFEEQKDNICCKAGCSECCKKGDYPISNIELEYLMEGYINLTSEIKLAIQNNFRNMKKGEACPFLINDLCSVYDYRPIICRVHGLAYLCKDLTVKIPYCVNSGKNYLKHYQKGYFNGEPIKENLDTENLLSHYKIEIRNLFDWIKR